MPLRAEKFPTGSELRGSKIKIMRFKSATHILSHPMTEQLKIYAEASMHILRVRSLITRSRLQMLKLLKNT